MTSQHAPLSTPPAGPSSRFYVSQRLRLHYADWGNPDAPPLLLIHGTRDHCRNWDWVAERLRHDWHIIAPDLRGHGDSQWSAGGQYGMATYVADIAQLVRQQNLAPLTIIGHSLGGNIALRYTGIYPEHVKKLVAIEGLGPAPHLLAKQAGIPIEDRMRSWIDEQRDLAARQPRRYATLDEAYARMLAENKHLSPEKARHLTEHGVSQNEDGSYGWKFDNYLRSWPPYDMPQPDVERLWSRIACPTLLVYGKESWASNPAEDGRIRPFRNARVELFERAGHWVHHDRLDAFVDSVSAFLAEPDQAPDRMPDRMPDPAPGLD